MRIASEYIFCKPTLDGFIHSNGLLSQKQYNDGTSSVMFNNIVIYWQAENSGTRSELIKLCKISVTQKTIHWFTLPILIAPILSSRPFATLSL